MSAPENLQNQTEFDEEIFDDLDLQGFDFAGKEFCRCTFRNTKLQESRWKQARLEDCVFEGCDLTHAVPSDMRANGVLFRGCKVLGVEWTNASLSLQISFEECDLRYCSFLELNLRKTSFVRCKATEAHFIGVDLTDADFSGTDLTGSTFEGTTLARANFITAHGAHLDPAKNRVKDVRIGVESAVLLAMGMGMKVDGFQSSKEPPVPRKPRPRGR